MDGAAHSWQLTIRPKRRTRAMTTLYFLQRTALSRRQLSQSGSAHKDSFQPHFPNISTSSKWTRRRWSRIPACRTPQGGDWAHIVPGHWSPPAPSGGWSNVIVVQLVATFRSGKKILNNDERIQRVHSLKRSWWLTDALNPTRAQLRRHSNTVPWTKISSWQPCR